jgi:hypothetical protein
MSTDEQKDRQPEEAPDEDGLRSHAPQASDQRESEDAEKDAAGIDGAGIDGAGIDGDYGIDEPADGPISLDRYMSRRRPPSRTGWMQIVSMVAMLGALILIIMYKDQCGQQISQLMGVMSDPPKTAPKGAARQTEVRYKLAPTPPKKRPAKASSPASRPTQ